jgi:hypothetical protein
LARGQNAVRSAFQATPSSVDWTRLFDYCAALFSEELDTVLTTAYMLRVPLLQRSAEVLLSNGRLIPFLASLPVVPDLGDKDGDHGKRLDVVAWEFFRQLVSPVVDPLNEARVKKVGEIIARDRGEIERLRKRCLALALELGEESDLTVLQSRIRNHIRAHVEEEIQAILEIDRQATRQLLDSVFSDEKTWAGIALLLCSLLSGGQILTAGSAIYALSSLGAKAFQVARKRRETLKASGYTLLYRMRGL